MTPRIDRCLCTGRTFDELLSTARLRNLDLEGLAECTEASRRCGLCMPYLRECLRTGRTVFHRLIRE